MLSEDTAYSRLLHQQQVYLQMQIMNKQFPGSVPPNQRCVMFNCSYFIPSFCCLTKFTVVMIGFMLLCSKVLLVKGDRFKVVILGSIFSGVACKTLVRIIFFKLKDFACFASKNLVKHRAKFLSKITAFQLVQSGFT